MDNLPAGHRIGSASRSGASAACGCQGTAPSWRTEVQCSGRRRFADGFADSVCNPIRRDLEMRALSIRQPWAWLIVNGHKDIENRSWRTNYRGPFLVHAGLKVENEIYDQLADYFEIRPPPPSEIERGGIVGESTILDCVENHDSLWFFGPYGFVLAHSRPLPFRQMRGRLGFFPVDA